MANMKTKIVATEQKEGKEKKTLDQATNELRDNVEPNKCIGSGSVKGGANTEEQRKSAQDFLPSPPKSAPADGEIRDE